MMNEWGNVLSGKAVAKSLTFLAIICLIVGGAISDQLSPISSLGHQKVRHERHKRQDYIKNFAVDPHDPAVDSGEWGPFSEASECTRTCGGGVSFRTRKCADVRSDDTHSCVGPSKIYISCNIQRCPEGTIDFRELQCSRFNTLKYEGKYYSWIPYFKTDNPCELYCSPKGERFQYRHAKMVIDGTPCRKGSMDICVEGYCMHVGCDMILGSKAKKDKCGVCKGDGSTCDTVAGVFDNDSLDIGYNDIILVPSGATNVRIEEKVATNNFLAVRNMKNQYYLNGNWRIDNPGDKSFAGTEFYYERNFQKPEKLWTLGATAEPLFIVLLYQEKNQGIIYEFSITKNLTGREAKDRYEWTVGEFVECPVTCGGGIQRREKTCTRVPHYESVDPSLCDPNNSPEVERVCGDVPCNSENTSTPASGPDFKRNESVNCIDSKFGCCSGNGRFATGPNMEGCDTLNSNTLTHCNNTSYGCCPDKISMARGPNFLLCCNYSRFGCCPDNVMEASGPNYAGCDCHASKFGCCPNGIQPAKGPRYYDCSCETYPFGCCQDNHTPATGPYFKGCDCLITLYGCCIDGRTPASGPDQEGCDCSTSRYGCCVDNVTPAKGLGYEGCPCGVTPFGCCPDEITVSKGPNYKDCPCSTTKYGCCPDNVTPATEENGKGCPCDTLLYGCCPDGLTPSKGPGFRGCPCDYSPFGCCPDGGIRGPNNAGCSESHPRPGELCRLEKEKGPCKNLSEKWFFDTDYGGCNRFWYGGCAGNANKFDSLEKCESVCVTPEGADACELPRVSGPCESYKTFWYYDASRSSCESFEYGGCLGNNNRFSTKYICEVTCLRKEKADVCQLPEVRGPCSGNFTKWHYIPQRDECAPFVFGGCRGNDNRFNDKQSCEKSCKKTNISVDTLPPENACLLTADPGPCAGSVIKYYYDAMAGLCKEFQFGGCEGNDNRFENRGDCERTCQKKNPQPDEQEKRPESVSPPKNHIVPEEEKAVCKKPKDRGNCTEQLPRWFYNLETGTCLKFIYTGCGGNENRFKTSDICIRVCTGVSPTTENEVIPASRCPPNNCGEIWCPHGIDINRDYASGCVLSCSCYNPCKNYSCPAGQRCAQKVTLNAEGESVSVPECRLINKPGRCPVVQNGEYVADKQLPRDGRRPECVDLCVDDSDCRGNQKCCLRGCARNCVMPIETKIVSRSELRTTPTTTTVATIRTTTMTTLATKSPVIPVEKEILIIAGSNVKIRCQVRGAINTPQWWRLPRIEGSSNRRMVIQQDGSLYISQVRGHDSGVYTCVAPVGKMGSSVSRSYRLVVYEGVSVDVKVATSNLRSGYPIQLDCRAKGLPPFIRVDLKWYRGNQLRDLQNGDRYSILKNGTLIINKGTGSDSGLYRCQVNTVLGRLSSNISIAIEETCEDNKLFAKCELIVKARYCDNPYYAQYCCRSCRLARIPAVRPITFSKN